MELCKAVWMFLILFSSSAVLSNPLAEAGTSIINNEKGTSSNNIQESTTELEPNIAAKTGSGDDIPKDLEHLLPTNSSNFEYKYVSDDNKDTEVSNMLNIPVSSVDYDLAPNKPKIIYKPDDSVNTSIFLKDDTINVSFEGMMRNYEGDKISETDHIAIVPGTIAAILAGVFLVISIVGYISLLSWRRYLENRYGNREMLVEEDYCEKNVNDLEHFSI